MTVEKVTRGRRAENRKKISNAGTVQDQDALFKLRFEEALGDAQVATKLARIIRSTICWMVLMPFMPKSISFWSILMLPYRHVHIDGLAWDCGRSGADTLKLLQSCARPSIWAHKSVYLNVLSCCHVHIDGSPRNWGSSSADELQLLQSCAVPSVSVRKLLYTYVAILPRSYWWIGAARL